VKFYNKRGTAEQWFKIGVKAVRHSRYVIFLDGRGVGFKSIVSGNP